MPVRGPDAHQEASVLSDVARGDTKALRRLVSSHHAAMIGLARTMVGQAQAPDIVQETWLKALAALPKFEGRSSLRVWLLRIVRNECLTHLRKESRQGETESLDESGLEERFRFESDGHWRVPPALWSADTPEALLAARQTHGVIEATLNRMPMTLRSVLIMRDVEGLPFEEICNVLELTESNVRVILHRARRRLWAAIDEMSGKPA
jgi:RNA polymerase sigma-70 factor, ECF subfamily